MQQKEYQILSNNKSIYAYLYDYPNICPYCNKHVIPIFLNDYRDREKNQIFATLLCPNSDCDKPFITQYMRLDNVEYVFNSIINPTGIKEEFSIEIKEVSPNFIKIYNQAYFGEQSNLLEICGVGYRKALEFLLKDYLIILNPEKKENIIKITISNCISSYVDDIRIKTTASRAIWLGNDHTHYEKKWDNKNLEDLKTLIKLTIKWIESEILTNKFNLEMQ